MRIKDLKKIIENLDDEAEVLVPGFDHSYSKTRGDVITVGDLGYGEFEEWYNETANRYSKPIKALVIS